MKTGKVKFVMVVLFSLVFIGSAVAGPKQAPNDWPKDMVFGGGPSPVTSHYLIAAYWTDLLRKEYGIRSTPITSGSEKNCLGVGTGKMNTGYAVGPTPVWAVKGERMFEKVGPQPIRAIAMTADLYINFFTLKKTGIDSISDLRGKKFSANYKGVTYLHMIAMEALNASGISENEVVVGLYGRAPEAWKNVASGLAHAGASTNPHGMAWIQEFFMTQDGQFIPLSDKEIKSITKRWDWTSPGIIPAGLYKGVEKDVPTVKLRMVIFVHKDAPDDLAYQLAKYMYHPDYRASFEKVHRVTKTEILLDRAVLDPVIPYHTGAIKFYKDMGKWTPKLDDWQKNYLKKLGQAK
jgi:TRAP transporter TAXI family solute receptor